MQQGSHPPIAAFGDAAGVIDLPRLIPPGDKAQIGADVAKDRRMREGSSIAATKAQRRSTVLRLG